MDVAEGSRGADGWALAVGPRLDAPCLFGLASHAPSRKRLGILRGSPGVLSRPFSKCEGGSAGGRQEVGRGCPIPQYMHLNANHPHHAK